MSEPTGKDQVERRTAHGELRVDQNHKRRLSGYAIVFDRLSVNLGGFRERIAPEAVDRTLTEAIDVRAFFDHNSGQVLGRLTAGTLRLSKDRRGLRIEIDTPDTSIGNDVLTSVERGDISGMSFGFRVMPDGDDWEEDDTHLPVRTVTDMRISEVSVVSMPAYEDTSVAVRSLQVFASSLRRPKVEYLRRLHRQRLAG